MKQRVLITGNAGYIGCVMVETLQRRGHEVVGVDTGFFIDSLRGQRESPCAMHVRDVRELTVDDLEGFHAVIHLAALPEDALGKLSSRLTDEINCNASAQLAAKAREAGVKRFLLASCCSVYGAGSSAMSDETSPISPLTTFACSKARAEEAISCLASNDFSPVYLRTATVYGVSPRLRMDLLLNNLVGWAYTTGNVPTFGDGSERRPVVHVRDLCQAFAAVLEAPRYRVHNQAFNVGRNEDNYTMGQLADIVLNAVPDSRLQPVAEKRIAARGCVVDFSKLQAMFPEFHPEWNATRGADEVYRSYCLARLTVDTMTSRDYTRLAQLKYLVDAGYLTKSLQWIRQELLAA